MDLAEDFIKFCVQWALDHCMDDISFLSEHFDKELIDRLRFVLDKPFKRLTYTEGIQVLEAGTQIRISGLLGCRFGQRARTLSRGRIFQTTRYHDRLSERDQELLYEDQ